MGRLIILFLLTGCVATVWYNYAPPSHRAFIPTPIKHTLEAADANFSDGIKFSHRWAARAIDKANTDRPSTQTDAVGLPPLTSTELDAALTEEKFYVGRNLAGSTFAGENLARSSFDGAKLEDASFADASLVRASARLIEAHGAVFHRTNASMATFDGSTLTHVLLIDATVDEASFIRADLSRAIARGGSFVQARFNGARLEQARFAEVDLRRASFTAANLTGAVFDQTQLHGANFDRARLSGADLRTATGITDRMLRLACGDATTRLPAGISISLCLSAEPAHLALSSPAAVLGGIGAKD